MLVLLIGVTSVFLLIMGVVTAIVLSHRVGSTISSGVSTTVEHPPKAIQKSPGIYVAALAAPLTGVVDPLTTGGSTQALETALHQLTPAQYLKHRGGQAFTLTVPNGEQLTAAERPIPAQKLLQAGFNPPGTWCFLVVARAPDEADGQVRGVIITELVTGGILLALLAAGGNWLIGRGLQPLAEMASTADEITSRGDLNARVTQSNDQTEVGRLGSAFNTMLDRIQQAFGARLRSEQKVREFAADASHELRTPLTTIRGYAELYRQGALGPDQLPDAMRRIEQEARRMSTLVAELLELARLDRTSSLDLAETDLAGLVRDAVADATAVEPGRPVRAEAPPRLVAVVDEARIRQVLANLLGNVRAHTPTETPVMLRLGVASLGADGRTDDPGARTAPWAAAPSPASWAANPSATGRSGGPPGASRSGGPPGPDWSTGPPAASRSGSWPTPWVLLEVADAGPGMSPEDAARAFDRFHRGVERGSEPVSLAREAGQGSADRAIGGGSGLGLSIVQAIARAHGGHATLESWPGRGTRVRIWLPAVSHGYGQPMIRG
jgi:two-component system OmpR family sensor kinase